MKTPITDNNGKEISLPQAALMLVNSVNITAAQAEAVVMVKEWLISQIPTEEVKPKDETKS